MYRASSPWQQTGIIPDSFSFEVLAHSELLEVFIFSVATTVLRFDLQSGQK